MFGYVRCYKEELKVKHVRQYQAYYCGICSRIQKNWGIFFRLSLSYDATFLGIVLDSYADHPEFHQFSCPFSLLGKKRNLYCDISILDYAAIVNGYLLIKKLEDNYLDDHNWFCGILSAFLKQTRGFRRFRCDYESLFSKWEQRYLAYMEAEKGRQYSTTDEYVNLFGEFSGTVYQDIAEYSDNNFQGAELRQELFVFGKILGMWVYTVDALDDYKKDKKNEKFNPLLYIPEEGEDLLEKVKRMLLLMETDLFVRFRKMGNGTNGEIVENILTYGMQTTLNRVIRRWEKEAKGAIDE
ncbi:MAG: hypothetical protein HFG62_08080 [Lachnospiraceae bacterium]|jgi:hypothetical protein|nr:hypothetical protein [Lachnospiraceae bacterium]